MSVWVVIELSCGLVELSCDPLLYWSPIHMTTHIRHLHAKFDINPNGTTQLISHRVGYSMDFFFYLKKLFQLFNHLKASKVFPCGQAQSSQVSSSLKKPFQIYGSKRIFVIVLYVWSYIILLSCSIILLTLQNRAQFSKDSRVPTWQRCLFSLF